MRSGFWKIWIIQKKIFLKMLRIVQFAKINGFWDFRFSFPSQWAPDLVIFRRFLKIKSLSIFSTLAGWICLILHIQVVLMVLDHLTTRNHMTWGQNGAKWGQLCRKNVKILILDYFFKFECLNMLDNADYDSTNGSFSFDHHKLPGLRAELCKIRLITWKKKSKYWFLTNC